MLSHMCSAVIIASLFEGRIRVTKTLDFPLNSNVMCNSEFYSLADFYILDRSY